MLSNDDSAAEVNENWFLISLAKHDVLGFDVSVNNLKDMHLEQTFVEL